ncbi:helix-turn-helix domain-containing protein [Halioxenophilus sp. WMMB6]|uniref:winged helix-turn-helix transcriptional regulator n=1 Tax=Halioxenophilus sp. WMMB6 TaxID=3073815 RepID=UPI00295EB89C|nr:helix-turn-helix domain-containing protein [Halioxenophilus sp. WMMB6]
MTLCKIENDKQRSPCALANGLDILGDRWSLLIIRDLMFTNRREFGHFLQSGEGISTNILADRLEKLQAAGVISKAPHPSHGKKFVYDLTERGIALAPTLIEISLWALGEIDGAKLPSAFLEVMQGDRNKLMAMIKNRQPVLRLKLE